MCHFVPIIRKCNTNKYFINASTEDISQLGFGFYSKLYSGVISLQKQKFISVAYLTKQSVSRSFCLVCEERAVAGSRLAPRARSSEYSNIACRQVLPAGCVRGRATLFPILTRFRARYFTLNL